MESTYRHFERDDVVAEYASFDFLLQPEQAILEQLAPRLPAARLLDVGVGAGRTTLHLAPRVAHYVGVDVSAPMVEACRRRCPPTPGAAAVDVAVADVRALPFPDDAAFDVVLFSFNSLDVVGDQEDRLQALREIHRVCGDEAAFCFSTHNLGFAQASFNLRPVLRQLVRGDAAGTRPLALLRRPSRLASLCRQMVRWRRLNAPVGRLRRRGHAMIVEERRRYELVQDFYADPAETIQVAMYYIRPHEQIAQLEAAGFDRVRVFTPEGEEVTDRAQRGLAQHWWLYFLCTKARRSGP